MKSIFFIGVILGILIGIALEQLVNIPPSGVPGQVSK
jgi:hypothetical protein